MIGVRIIIYIRGPCQKLAACREQYLRDIKNENKAMEARKRLAIFPHLILIWISMSPC